MLSANFFKAALNVNLLLGLCILTSHIFWLVESHSNGDGLHAFRKLLQKTTNDTGIRKVKLQASIFGEKKMLTSTLPIETQATPALPGISSQLPEVLQNIVVISDHNQESTVVISEQESASKMEQKLSSEVSTLNEPDLPTITNLLNNESRPLENASAVAANETANATLSSTEVDQASRESEVMPSFDEWKRRMLAEQSVKGENVAQPPSLPPKKIGGGQKRRRNYASYECGAKVVAANAESESTGRILNEQMDEYMLNPCNAHIWFVIELCETIQVTQIEIANFELFSSLPKDVTIYGSDRFPTRDWTSLGGFVAQDHRTLQSFTLQQQGYGKFMKIEMLSHYGTEHYCPLSVIRVFGTSMVDEYEEMETVHHPSEDEEDRLDIPYDGKDVSSKDLFGSAKEAVYNMVRKAAQALTRENEGSSGNTTDVPETVSITDNGDADIPISSNESFYQHLLACGMCCSLNKTVFPMNSYCGFIQSLLGPKDLEMHCNLRICQCLANNYPIEKDYIEINATIVAANASEPVVDQIDNHNTTTTSQESHCTTTTDAAASLLLVTPIAMLTHPPLQPSVEETQDTPPAIELVQDTIHPSPSVSHIPDEFLKNDTSWEAEPKHLTNGATPGQKESVFVRLNNRIRGLETNLSLSTQYLQELSQRYRRQMEDMQRVFNRTIGVLNDTAHRAAEKDARQQETIQELQEKVSALTRSSDIMMTERHAIYRQVYEAHLFLIVTEVIVMVTVLSLCLRRFTMTATLRRSVPAPLYSSPLKRHNSVSHVHSTPAGGEKKRRPSGEVSPAGSYAHLMIVEPTVPIFLEPAPPKAKKKHRNKKPRHLQRSVSNPNLATFSSSHPNIENIPSRSIFGSRPASQNTGPIPFQNLSNGILELVKLPKEKCLLNK